MIVIFVAVASLSPLLKLSKTIDLPPQYLDFVIFYIPIFGLAFGVLISQLIFCVWNGALNCIEAPKKAKQKQQTNDTLRVQCKASYSHMTPRQIMALKELTMNEATYDLSIPEFTVLYENDYIKPQSKINNDTYLVCLNPVIRKTIIGLWNDEIKENTDEFFKEMTTDKEKIIDLMLEKDHEDESAISFNIKNLVIQYVASLRVQSEEGGFWLYFSHRKYQESFSSRVEKELLDEVWINEDRIQIPATGEI